MSSKSSKRWKPLAKTVNVIGPEKIARDMLRIELAAMLSLARAGHVPFAQDLLESASPSQRGWIKDEMKKIEAILRDKTLAVENDV